MTALTLADLTSATLEGTGTFDTLMRAAKVHLDEEFKKGRIKGPEFATVYLGSLEPILQTALQFLLSKDKIGLEAQLLEKQIAIAEAQLQTALVQKSQADVQLQILEQQLLKVPAEIAQLEAQTELTTQQKTNLVAEALNIPKQGVLLDAQAAISTQQKTNLEAEALNIPKQGAVLDAQECKLRAEYDVAMETKLRTVQETTLLTWKVTTEKAQTQALGVDAESVIGKQKTLYQRQADGFTRDAEQKVTKILADTWSVRRSSDDATVADAVNMLNDATVGRAVAKMLAGIGA